MGRRCCCGSCDCDCLQFEDDFATDSIGDYSQVSGSWSISTGRLRCSDDNAIIMLGTSAEEEHNFECTTYYSASGDIFRMIIAYKDSSNYLYATTTRVSAFSFTAELHEVISGVDSMLDSCSVNNGPPAQYAMSYRNGEVAWSGNDGGVAEASQQPDANSSYQIEGMFGTVSDPSALGKQVGIGIDSVYAEFSFDQFKLRTFCDLNCPNALALACIAGTEFTSVSVVISGVANGNCSTCSDWNATYILDTPNGAPGYIAMLVTDGSPSTVLPDCESGYPGVAYYRYQDLIFHVYCFGGNVVAAVSVRRINDVGSVVATEATGSVILESSPDCCKVDCLSLVDGLVIDMADSDSSNDLCDWSNATATITAVRAT